jgi:hypothetical protein
MNEILYGLSILDENKKSAQLKNHIYLRNGNTFVPTTLVLLIESNVTTTNLHMKTKKDEGLRTKTRKTRGSSYTLVIGVIRRIILNASIKTSTVHTKCLRINKKIRI